jgi:hypothetical protein
MTTHAHCMTKGCAVTETETMKTFLHCKVCNEPLSFTHDGTGWDFLDRSYEVRDAHRAGCPDAKFAYDETIREYAEMEVKSRF